MDPSCFAGTGSDSGSLLITGVLLTCLCNGLAVLLPVNTRQPVNIAESVLDCTCQLHYPTMAPVHLMDSNGAGEYELPHSVQRSTVLMMFPLTSSRIDAMKASWSLMMTGAGTRCNS